MEPQLLVIYLLKSAIIFLSLSLEAHLAISVVIFLKEFKSLVFMALYIHVFFQAALPWLQGLLYLGGIYPAPTLTRAASLSLPLSNLPRLHGCICPLCPWGRKARISYLLPQAKTHLVPFL